MIIYYSEFINVYHYLQFADCIAEHTDNEVCDAYAEYMHCCMHTDHAYMQECSDYVQLFLVHKHKKI